MSCPVLYILTLITEFELPCKGLELETRQLPEAETIPEEENSWRPSSGSSSTAGVTGLLFKGIWGIRYFVHYTLIHLLTISILNTQTRTALICQRDSKIYF